MAARSLRRRAPSKPKTSRQVSSRPKRPEDDGPELFCICRQPYDSRRFMIGCDHCDGWFHARCVNITVAEAERLQNFICPPCKSKRKGRKDSKDRKKSGTSRAKDSGMALYRPPSRKPSARIKRHDIRRAQHSDGIPYEPAFDTSGSEMGESGGEQAELSGSDSDGSEFGASKAATLTVNVHAYEICREDLGQGLALNDLSSDDRDKALLAHLREREFEIERELHKAGSRKQVLAAGIAFAKRESKRKKAEINVARKDPLDPEDLDSETIDGIFRGMINVAEMHEITEHNIRCRTCYGYIPVDKFAKHLPECAWKRTRGGEVNNYNSSVIVKEDPSVLLPRKRKRGVSLLESELIVCGCPYVDPAAEPPQKRRPKEDFKAAKSADRNETAMKMDSTSPKSGDVKSASNGVDKPVEEGVLKKMTRSQTVRADATRRLNETIGTTLEPVVSRGAINSKYGNYCNKLREECAEHLGWIALWEAEIAQQEYFHNNRLELVREEITAVNTAASERKQEIEHAKRLTKQQADNELASEQGAVGAEAPTPAIIPKSEKSDGGMTMREDNLESVRNEVAARGVVVNNPNMPPQQQQQPPQQQQGNNMQAQQGNNMQAQQGNNMQAPTAEKWFQSGGGGW